MTDITLQNLLFATSPGLLALGLCLLCLPWLSRESHTARGIMISVAAVLIARYFLWRVTMTLPSSSAPLDRTVGIVFVVGEGLSIAAGLISLFFLSRTRSRSAEVECNLTWYRARTRRPLIDVLICTFNEEQAILERTIIGAMGMDYPNHRTWVLDDGRRPWLQDLCERLGCGYITRPDNRNAKAGNINHALERLARLTEPPEFVSILDADFVPMPTFLSRTLALFHDQRVGVVQTPQHFINADPIQTNLSAARVWPDEQRFFFDVVMPSLDAWSTAFCCGTSSLIRFSSLREIGGVPTDSVTEDYLLTLRLKERGYETVYLNEALTLGLAPEGLKEYITQRGRWCLGFMQITRGRSGPLSPHAKLPFITRLSLCGSFLNWAAIYSVKLLGLALPILYLLFDVRAIDASISEAAQYFLPYFVWLSLVIAWVSGGRVLPVMSDVCQLIAAPAVARAVVAGLVKPQGQKFKVTAKGGDRDRRFVEWPLLRIYAGILLLTIASIGYSFYVNVRGDTLGYSTLALVWAWYNAIVLLLTCIVCIEQPRRRKAERFSANKTLVLADGRHRQTRQLLDISITGARLAGPAFVPKGTTVMVEVDGSMIPASIVRANPDSFAVRFDPSLTSRTALIRHFYANAYVKALEHVKAAKVARVVLSRLLR